MTTLEKDFNKYRCWCSFFDYDPKNAKSLKAYVKLKGLTISRSAEAPKKKVKKLFHIW